MQSSRIADEYLLYTKFPHCLGVPKENRTFVKLFQFNFWKSIVLLLFWERKNQLTLPDILNAKSPLMASKKAFSFGLTQETREND